MRDVTLLSVPPVSRRRRTSGRHADEEMGGQHMSQTLTAQTDGHPSPDLVSGTARGSRFSPFTNISVPAISHFREITTPSILHTSSSSSIQPTTPTQSPIPTANISTPSSASPSFQKRTFYRSSPIDEHRAPVAEWHPSQPPSRSLSVNASTNSIDTLDSLFTPFSNASSTSTETRAYGYSGWRVDDHQREHWPALRNSGAFRADRGVDWVMPCCVEGKIEEEVEEGFSVVRVRDSVFEIGVDGRIRRQTMW